MSHTLSGVRMSLLNSRRLARAGIVLAAVLLAACASKVADVKQYSGFLGDYSQLKETKAEDGTPVMRWVSPDFKKGQYTNLLIDPIVIYPKPVATVQVDVATAEEAVSYLDTELRQRLSTEVDLVNSIQPNTIRMRAAVTGVRTSAEDFQFYEVIPVALIVAGTMAAAGERDRNIDVYLEVELTDANTNEVLGRVVRKAISKNTVKNDKVQVTLDEIKPTLDLWVDQGERFAKKFMVTK
jgi:hypothetical protein